MHKTKSNNLDDSKDRLTSKINNILEQTIRNAQDEIASRFVYLIGNNQWRLVACEACIQLLENF